MLVARRHHLPSSPASTRMHGAFRGVSPRHVGIDGSLASLRVFYGNGASTAGFLRAAFVPVPGHGPSRRDAGDGPDVPLSLARCSRPSGGVDCFRSRSWLPRKGRSAVPRRPPPLSASTSRRLAAALCRRPLRGRFRRIPADPIGCFDGPTRAGDVSVNLHAQHENSLARTLNWSALIGASPRPCLSGRPTRRPSLLGRRDGRPTYVPPRHRLRDRRIAADRDGEGAKSRPHPVPPPRSSPLVPAPSSVPGRPRRWLAGFAFIAAGRPARDTAPDARRFAQALARGRPGDLRGNESCHARGVP